MHAFKAVTEQADSFGQFTGSVIEANADALSVRTDFGELQARKALSCLIMPETGDRVLLAGSGEQVFVIAVLERSADTPLRLALDRDVQLAVANGRCSIAAAHGIELVSAADMGLTATELNVRAGSARVFLNNMQYLGQQLCAELGKIRLIGSLFDSVMERISQKVKRSYRAVEELDHVRAEQIDYRAHSNVSLRGKNTLVTAEELVKFDGDQIHMG